MTKKQLLKKLIYHYEWCIEYLPKKNWYDFLHKWEVYYGVCWLSKDFYSEKIYEKKWVDKYRGIYDDDNDYWCKKPSHSESRKECIELLTIRLNNLKKELSITK